MNPKRARLVLEPLLFSSLLALASACHNPPSVPESAPEPESAPQAQRRPVPAARSASGPEEKMEWKGQYCGQGEPSTRVVTTAAQWAALWADIGREAPQADLNAHFAAAVFLGQRNTGGYSVRFLEPVAEGKTLKVLYEAPAPKGFVTQAFTQPYAVRLFPRTDLQVVVAATGNP